jgi:hypothetical protein
MIRNKTFYNKGVVDQWGMIRVGLFVIHSTAPETWMNSFHACNLDPSTRVPVPEWCKKIEHFLQAGKTFKSEAPLDLYALFSAIWQHIPCQEKKKLYDVVKDRGGGVHC